MAFPPIAHSQRSGTPYCSLLPSCGGRSCMMNDTRLAQCDTLPLLCFTRSHRCLGSVRGKKYRPTSQWKSGDIFYMIPIICCVLHSLFCAFGSQQHVVLSLVTVCL